MGLFNKKKQVYARPTGWRARAGWQIFSAFRRHGAVVVTVSMGALYLSIFLVAFMIIGVIRLENILLCWQAIWEGIVTFSGPEATKLLKPFGVMLSGTPMFLALFMSTVLFDQLVHVKHLSMPDGVAKVLRFGLMVWLPIVAVCFLLLLKLTWVGAIWCLAISFFATGIVAFFVSFGLPILAILSFLPAVFLIALTILAYEGHDFEVVSTGWLTGSLVLLPLGLSLWCIAWYRFHRCWILRDNFLVFAMNRKKDLLRMRTRVLSQKGGKENFLVARFGQEQERRIESLSRVFPETFWAQVRFFSQVTRPNRTGLIMLLLIAAVSPLVVGLSDDAGFLVFLSCYPGCFFLMFLIMPMLAEWQQFFSMESLLPMTRKRYVMVAGLGRIKNVLYGITFPMILLPVLFWICEPNDFSLRSVGAVLLAYVAVATLASGLMLITAGTPSPVWCSILFLIGGFVFARFMFNRSLNIADGLVLAVFGILLIPIGFWQLGRVEPARVWKV